MACRRELVLERVGEPRSLYLSRNCSRTRATCGPSLEWILPCGPKRAWTMDCGPNLLCTLVLGSNLEWIVDRLRRRLADVCISSVRSCSPPCPFVSAQPVRDLSNYSPICSCILLSLSRDPRSGP
ncbi:unnamed protein product [Prunus armeniaca]